MSCGGPSFGFGGKAASKFSIFFKGYFPFLMFCHPFLQSFPLLEISIVSCLGCTLLPIPTLRPLGCFLLVFSRLLVKCPENSVHALVAGAPMSLGSHWRQSLNLALPPNTEKLNENKLVSLGPLESVLFEAPCVAILKISARDTQHSPNAKPRHSLGQFHPYATFSGGVSLLFVWL